jgi:ATP-binding cassette subfamily B protein
MTIDASMRLLEPMPAAVEQTLGGLVPAGEQIIIQVYTDLDADSRFANQWVVVTDKRVLVLPEVGDGAPVDVLITEIVVARSETLVGGSRLEIERRGMPTVLVPYSGSLAAKFSEVVRGIEQLRKQEDLLISTQLDRTRCEKCNRLLPEKNGLCPACIKRWNTMARIAHFLKPYKGRAAILIVATLSTTLAELAPPQVIKHLVDKVLVPTAGDAAMDERLVLLGMLVLALVGVRLWSWGSEFLHGWIIAWLSARVTADIRARLYRRLEMLSMQFYDKRQVGSLISRVTRDSDMLQDFLVDGLPYTVINALLIGGIFSILMTMSWKLTLYILVPVPFMLVWSFYFWRRMRGIFHKYGRSWSGLSTRLNEALNGIRVVKAFAQEEREIEAFKEKNDHVSLVSRRTARNFFTLFATMHLVTSFGMLIVWYFGGRSVLEEELTLGELMAFYSYMWLIYGPLEWFAEISSWMTRAFAGAERIFEIIDSPAEAYEDPNAVAVPYLKGGIVFRDVTFGYDKSKPVLHEIDLEVEAEEMIGLVGKSGVGKTTTINLIARFYDVDHGVIEMDGVDVRKIRLEDLRRQIGIVLQEPVLFSGTVAENIAYAKPGAPLEEVIAAAKHANAHQFIMAKADGYDSQVGERGGNLSGGEKQRVAIARAVLHNPRILILDEATSSVDVQTEKHIQEAIARLVQGRTTIAIAHRLSTLRNADRLVVLEGGRIVEVGTHAELMEKQGTFYDLVETQRQVAEIIAVKE